MNIFKKNRYANDCGRMAFYMLVLSAFFASLESSASTYTLIIGLFFLIGGRAFGAKKWHGTPLDKALWLFVLMGFLSIFDSPQKAFSFYNWYHLVGVYVIIYYLSAEFLNEKERFKMLFYALALGSIVVIAYAFYQYLVGISTVSEHWVDTSAFPTMKLRLYSLWENPNLFAGYLDVGMSMALGIGVMVKGRLRLICAAFFAAMGACLVLTYARGALISIAFMLVVYAVLYNRKLLVPLILVGAVLLLADHTLFMRMDSLLKGGDTSTQLRIALWESTLAMIMDHPLLGIGWGAYYFVYPLYDFYMQGHFIKIVHAHNMYLNIAAEIGLIGFGAYMYCFFSTLWRALRNFRYVEEDFLRGILLGCGLALVSLAVNGLTDYVLFNTELSLLYWLLCGLVAALLRLPSVQKAREREKALHVGLTRPPETEPADMYHLD